MRTQKKHKTQAATIALIMGTLIPVSAIFASDPAGATPSEVIQSFNGYIEQFNQAGIAQDSCQLEGIVDFSNTQSLKVGAGTACTKFFNNVCNSSEAERRNISSSRKYDSLIIAAIIQKMPEGTDEEKKNKKLAREALDKYFDAKNLSKQFEDSVIPPKDKKSKAKTVAGLLSGDALAAFQKVKSEQDISVLKDKVYKNIKNTFYGSDAQGGIADTILKSMKERMKDALTDQQKEIEASLASYPRNGDDAEFNRNKQFVIETFQRMRDSVETVSLDQQAGRDVCYGNERNAFLYGNPGSGTPLKVVLCPATLLSGNVEIAGAIASALGHAVDSCAMDSMTVGKPAISLSAVLEPLRSCLGEKVTQKPAKEGLRVLPELRAENVLLANSTSKYSDKTGPFAIQGEKNPHCSKPVTAEDLRRGADMKQRDQSNDAVAQFFANRALSSFLNNKKGLEELHIFSQQNKDMVKEAFASYCGAGYNPAGSHPPVDLMLNNVVGVDRELGRILGCVNDSAAETRRVSESGKKYFSTPDFDALAQKGAAAPKSCESELHKGFANYVRLLSSKPLANTQFKDIAPTNPAAEPKTGSSAVSDISKATPEQLAARSADLTAALDEARVECMKSTDSGFPFDVGAVCKGRTSRVDVEIPMAKPSVARGSYEFNIGCQSRCLCGNSPAACFVPDVAYRGQSKPPIVPLAEKDAASPIVNAAVQNDLQYYRKFDSDKGAFSVAAKSCLINAPGSDAVKNQCTQSKSGPVIKIPGNPVHMIGETSGKMLDFGCTFNCDCAGDFGCKVDVSNPAAPEKSALATAADRAAAAQAAKPGIDPVYLSTVPLRGVQLSATRTLSGQPQAVASAQATAEAAPSDGTFHFGKVKTRGVDPAFAKHTAFRLESIPLAGQECDKVIAKSFDIRKGQGATTPKAAFCQNSFAPADLDIRVGYNPIDQSDLHFAYSCTYDCSKDCAPDKLGPCARIDYLGQTSGKKIEINSASDVEKARAADWDVIEGQARVVCLERMNDKVHVAAVLKSCEPGKVIREEQPVCVTGSGGEYLGTRLPFTCSYACHAKGDYSVTSIAEPLSLNGSKEAYQAFDKALGDRQCNVSSNARRELTPAEFSAKYEPQAQLKCEESAVEKLGSMQCKANPGIESWDHSFLEVQGTDLGFRCRYTCDQKGGIGVKAFASGVDVTRDGSKDIITVTVAPNAAPQGSVAPVEVEPQQPAPVAQKPVAAPAVVVAQPAAPAIPLGACEQACSEKGAGTALNPLPFLTKQAGVDLGVCGCTTYPGLERSEQTRTCLVYKVSAGPGSATEVGAASCEKLPQAQAPTPTAAAPAAPAAPAVSPASSDVDTIASDQRVAGPKVKERDPKKDKFAIASRFSDLPKEEYAAKLKEADQSCAKVFGQVPRASVFDADVSNWTSEDWDKTCGEGNPRAADAIASGASFGLYLDKDGDVRPKIETSKGKFRLICRYNCICASPENRRPSSCNLQTGKGFHYIVKD